MKIIPVKKPFQGHGTLPQDWELVEYVSEFNSIDNMMELRQHVPHWCVMNENLRIRSEEHPNPFLAWVEDKEAAIRRAAARGEKIEGVYLYDIEAMFINDKEYGLCVRFDYIH